jgi:oxygen-independent coproporphyrinogen-3 oxidase
MFGLYIHIPYCRSKCRYCDFYSTPCPDGVPEAYIDALCREMDRFSPCGSTPLRPDTLYFGGGTPSLLTPAQAARLIRAAGPAPGAEITLEANPETVTPERLAAFRRAGVNRLSLGIQTARDDSLARLGRRHTAAQSRRALGMAVQAGFTDISGDLMLALPAYTMAELDETIALLAESGCTHISGYLLKIEPNTVFGKCPPEALPGDDAAADFYLAAVEKLAALGYAQYEISNFARPALKAATTGSIGTCGDYLGLWPHGAQSAWAASAFATPAGTAAFLAAPAVYEPQGECTAEDYINAPAPSFPAGFPLSALRARVRRILLLRKAPVPANACGAWAGCFRRQRPAPDGPRGMLVQNSILCRACVKLFYCSVHFTFFPFQKNTLARGSVPSAGRSSLQVSYDLTFL